MSNNIKWIIVCERESGKWIVIGKASPRWMKHTEYPNGAFRRGRKVSRPDYFELEYKCRKLFGSPFISGAELIDAETQEEAWQLASTYPKPKLKMRSQWP